MGRPVAHALHSVRVMRTADDEREERNGRALARELTRLRTFEESIAEVLGTPVGKPGSGTREMLERLKELLEDKQRLCDRLTEHEAILRARAELAIGVLAGARIDRHPIVLRAAADAVQLRALAVEGQKARADDEVESFGMGDSSWLARLAIELRRVERELREGE